MWKLCLNFKINVNLIGQWRESLPNLWSNSHKIASLQHYFQSMAKQPLGIDPMSNFNSINGQTINI